MTQVDEAGNKYELYPDVKTDSTLSTSGKAADAKAVGNKTTKIDNSIKTYDDMMANTVEGHLADSLAIKAGFNAMNDDLTADDNLKFRFATDGEGNYGYLGADDSFIPFKSGGGSVVSGSITLPKDKSYQTVDCGFAPNRIMVFSPAGSCRQWHYYDGSSVSSAVTNSSNSGGSGSSDDLLVNDNGFQIRNHWTNYDREVYYLACRID